MRVPLEVDLYNYTHIALIDATLVYKSGIQYSDKKAYEELQELLSNSPLEIINPRKFDKKKFKKDRRFLRQTKNPKWLYLYYDISLQRDASGFAAVKDLILRDYNNKIIYSALVKNEAALTPLINF